MWSNLNYEGEIKSPKNQSITKYKKKLFFFLARWIFLDKEVNQNFAWGGRSQDIDNLSKEVEEETAQQLFPKFILYAVFKV